MIRIDGGQLNVADGGKEKGVPRTVPANQAGVQAAPLPVMKRRWRRRFLWSVVLLLIVAGLLVVAVQLVLWSDYPRRFVVATLEKQLGLRVEAESLSTTWWGQTRLKNVALSLPLGKESFVRVPGMEVRHTALIPLLIWRTLEVKAITLESPTLVVQQDRTGRWDIVAVGELLGRVAGGQQAAALAVLPEIELHGGTVRLLPWRAAAVEVGPIELQGKPSGPLVWLYELRAGAEAGAFAAMKGEVAPGGNWRHALRAEVRHVEPWVKPFAPWLPEGAGGEVGWEGALAGDEVNGVLELAGVHAEGVEARGFVEVSAGAGRAELQPRAVRVETPFAMVPRVAVRGGRIAATAEGIKVENLAVRGLGGGLVLGGQYRLATGEGNARVTWEDLHVLPDGVTTGEATVVLAGGEEGAGGAERRLLVEVRGRGVTGAGTVEATAAVRARGSAWNQMTWEAEVGRAAWSGWPPVELREVAGRGSVTPTELTLTSITGKGPGAFSGNGVWRFGAGEWSAAVTAEGIPIARSKGTLAATINARGDKEAVRLERAVVEADGVTAEAAGRYQFDKPQPADLEVQLRETAFSQAFPEADGVATRPAGVAGTASGVRGKVRADARLRGTVSPLKLEIAGHFSARDLVVGDREIGNAEVEVTGDVTERQVQVGTTDMAAFGGHWKWSAEYPFESRRATVRAAMTGVSLKEVSEAAKLKVVDAGGGVTSMLTGVASGNVVLEFPDTDLMLARGEGALQLTDPHVMLPAAGSPTLAARAAHARVVIDQGRIEVTADATQGDGEAAAELGTLNGTFVLGVRNPTHIDTKVRLQNWTAGFEGVEGRARFSGELTGAVDTRTASATGEAKTRTELWYREEKIGDIEADAMVAGRVIHVSRVGADVLGGTVRGTGSVNLDDLLGTRVSMTWEGLDAERLSLFHPWLEGVEGVYAGSVLIGPAEDPRALEPLKLVATLSSRGGTFHGIEIGGGSAEAYASRTRVVLNRSTVALAGGHVTLWGRSIRRNDAWVTSQLRLGLEGVELNPLVQAIRPKSDEMVGKLSGEIDALGDPRTPESLSGGGTIKIEASDLVNSDIIGGLLAQMNVSTAGRQADGQGRMTFLFEQGNAHITELSYLNRGVTIRGTGNVGSLLSFPQSSIDFVAAGTLRPLRNVRLPLLADVDEIIGVLQSQVTTIRATGTLADPTVVPVLLDQAGRDLSELLMGDVHSR